MTESFAPVANNTFEDFKTAVTANLKTLEADVAAALQKIADQFNNSFLESPWTIIVGGPADAAYLSHAKDALESAFKAVWNSIKNFAAWVWDQVGKLAGDPGTVMKLVRDYQHAAGRIRDEKTVIDRIVRDVSDYWQGTAYKAFSGVADEQKAAIAGIDSGLTTAATACANEANEIFSIWGKARDALLDYIGQIIDSIEGATDAGQLVTFDAGPVIKVVATIVLDFAKFAAALTDFMAGDETAGITTWTNLNDGLDGLDAKNEWPGISHVDRPKLTTKSDWTPA